MSPNIEFRCHDRLRGAARTCMCILDIDIMRARKQARTCANDQYIKSTKLFFLNENNLPNMISANISILKVNVQHVRIMFNTVSEYKVQWCLALIALSTVPTFPQDDTTTSLFISSPDPIEWMANRQKERSDQRGSDQRGSNQRRGDLSKLDYRARLSLSFILDKNEEWRKLCRFMNLEGGFTTFTSPTRDLLSMYEVS